VNCTSKTSILSTPVKCNGAIGQVALKHVELLKISSVKTWLTAAEKITTCIFREEEMESIAGFLKQL
jgi:hypothetical protein